MKLAPKIYEETAGDVSKYFHLINNIARIGDHAKKILDDSIDMRKKGITFKIFENNTPKEITNFSELLEKSKKLQKDADLRNFERLQQNKCTMELGSLYISTFTHFKSICSHLENITDLFGNDNKNLTFNTFEGKDYIMVINQNINKKIHDILTNRKFNTNENSINDISEKINKSFG